MKRIFLLTAMIMVSICVLAKQQRYRFAYMECFSFGVFVDYDLELIWDSRTNQCQIVSQDSKIDTIFFKVVYSQSIDDCNCGKFTVIKLPNENCRYDIYNIRRVYSRNANLTNITDAKLSKARNTQSMDVPEITLTFNIKTNKQEYRVEMVFTGEGEYNYDFQMLMRRFLSENPIDSSKLRHEEGVVYTDIPNRLIEWYKKYSNLKTTVDYYLYDDPQDFKRTYKEVEPGFDLKILHLLQGYKNYSIETDSLPIVVDAPHNINRDLDCRRFNEALLMNAILNASGKNFMKRWLHDTNEEVTFVTEYDSMGYVLNVTLKDSKMVYPFDYGILAKIKDYLIESNSRFLICERTFIRMDYGELDYLCSEAYRDELKDIKLRHYNYFDDNKGYLEFSFSQKYCTGVNDYLDDIRKYLYPNCLPNCRPCSCWMTNDYIFKLLQSDSYQKFIREYLALDESDKVKVLWELAHPLDIDINLDLCIKHVSECELLTNSEKEQLIKALSTKEGHIVSPGSHTKRGIS